MLHTVLIVLLLYPITFSSHETSLDEKDRSGPTISLQSTVYQDGDKWYCPLCRQEVPHGSRAGWDNKLALSEWHDVLIEKKYFEEKIRYITDEELVNSLGDRLSNSFQHLNYRPHLFVYLWERTSCPTEYPSDEQDIPYV